jgi:dethiobiotin synthetase
MAKKYFISGIGTDVGKTIVSAVLTEALQADYWKPVQAGDLHFGDTDKVRTLISNDKSVFHPERYRLNTPASPHYAAEIDGINISLSDFCLPETDRSLIVEGAGGLMVPLNSKETVLDLIAYLQIPLVLVSRNYLGSINHTMLSIEVLFKRNIEIAGIVFNGKTNQATETWILNNSGLNCLARIDEANNNIDSEWIKAEAEKNISIIELMT